MKRIIAMFLLLNFVVGFTACSGNTNSLAPGAGWFDGERFAASTSKEEIESWLNQAIPTTLRKTLTCLALN